MGGRIGEPFRMGSPRMGSNVGQALPRSGLVQDLFCGVRRYVALVISVGKSEMRPCSQRHIISNQRLCRNCINAASFFQCLEGEGPCTSQAASAFAFISRSTSA